VGRIRVFISATSGVLRGFLADIIAAEDDMEVVGVAPAAESLIRAVSAAQPDVLVVSEPSADGAPALTGPPYAASPLRVVVMIDHDRQALIYELRAWRSLSGEVSLPSLVEAIRTAVARKRS
jgi:DNA-binding NarL/FixJ family response regulator